MKNKPLSAKSLELGQMAFGNPVGRYECPKFVEAFIEYLFTEIERIYWNKNQIEWDRDGNLGFNGIDFRPYYWGNSKKEAAKPNFSYANVEVRWYKHPGRSMTVNVSWTEKQWVKWFDDCLKNIVDARDEEY